MRARSCSTRPSPATARRSPTTSRSRGRTSRCRCASLRYLDPYREDLDKGDANNFVIISNGPYKLEGDWTEGTGGTFVRNDNWDEAPTRSARRCPDKWDFREGDEDEAIYEQMFADSGDASTA